MKEKMKHIGDKVVINAGRGLFVEVRILDYKSSYGNDRWLVSPISGVGRAWVEGVVFHD